MISPTVMIAGASCQPAVTRGIAALYVAKATPKATRTRKEVRPVANCHAEHHDVLQNACLPSVTIVMLLPRQAEQPKLSSSKMEPSGAPSNGDAGPSLGPSATRRPSLVAALWVLKSWCSREQALHKSASAVNARDAKVRERPS